MILRDSDITQAPFCKYWRLKESENISTDAGASRNQSIVHNNSVPTIVDPDGIELRHLQHHHGDSNENLMHGHDNPTVRRRSSGTILLVVLSAQVCHIFHACIHLLS